MQARWWNTLLTLGRGSVEILLFLPVALIPGAYALGAPDVWIWIAALPLYYVLGYLAGIFLRPRKIGYVGLIIVGISLAGNALLPGIGAFMLFSVPIGMLLTYRGIRYVTEPWHTYFPVLYYVAGLLIYFFSAAVLWFIESFRDFLPTLNTLGVICLVVAFWFLSQANLKKGSLPGKKEAKLSRAVVVQNGLWMGVLLGLVFLIVLLGRIREGFLWVRDQITLAVQRLVDWLSKQSGGDTERQDGHGNSTDINLGELEENASGHLDWLQTVLFYVTIGILVTVLILIVIFVSKKMPGWKEALMKWLRRAFHMEDKATVEGYTDEKEALMNFKGWRQKMADQVKDWGQGLFNKEVKWEELDSREKVRWLYRSWITQLRTMGYRFGMFRTPRETKTDVLAWQKDASIPDGLIDLYEDVRYGSMEADLERVNRLRSQLQPPNPKQRK